MSAESEVTYISIKDIVAVKRSIWVAIFKTTMKLGGKALLCSSLAFGLAFLLVHFLKPMVPTSFIFAMLGMAVTLLTIFTMGTFLWSMLTSNFGRRSQLADLERRVRGGEAVSKPILDEKIG
jgi:hypothetical protein